MKKVKFEEAVGNKLAHDIVGITPKAKGRAFKRGHLIKKEDKEDFAMLGKETFYVLEEEDKNKVHEEDAAKVLYEKLTNDDFTQSEIVLGKINLLANKPGIFKVDSEKLFKLNMLGEISVASIKNDTYVNEGDIVASMRIIPLFTTISKINEINNLDLNNTFKITSIKINKIALLTTGNEIFSGKIIDAFKPVLEQKFNKYNLKVNEQIFIQDDLEIMTSKIKEYLNSDNELIILTGGMSVDPDDITADAIKASGVDIITYGTPIIPGSMFLIGYYKDKTIVGLPGAVIHSEHTAFDELINKILIKEKYSVEEINKLAVGGLLIG